jgi:hypothetical protein
MGGQRIRPSEEKAGQTICRIEQTSEPPLLKNLPAVRAERAAGFFVSAAR